MRNVIAPAVIDFSGNYKNVSVSVAYDELFLVPEDFYEVRFDLPFGGFFLLPLTLLIAARRYTLIKVLCMYHAALIFIFPILGLLVFQGFKSVGILTLLHEKVYKAMFIILGLLALREADQSLKGGNN